MNTIGDAISYAVDGVYYIAATIKYYVHGVPPAIPDDGEAFVFVNSVTETETPSGQFNNVSVEEEIISLDKLLTKPETTMPPPLDDRNASRKVLEGLCDTVGQTSC